MSPVMRERIGTGANPPPFMTGDQQPVVFVGPFEHHSNEISWRECYVEVVEVELTDDGLFDLDDLRTKVASLRFRHRPKIGSSSAPSNVTDVRAPTRQIASVMHQHGGAAFFDFAVLAPYVAIDVQGSGDAFYDGVFILPHKYVGGPGSCGILLLHEKHYRGDLAPTFGVWWARWSLSISFSRTT